MAAKRWHFQNYFEIRAADPCILKRKTSANMSMSSSTDPGKVKHPLLTQQLSAGEFSSHFSNHIGSPVSLRGTGRIAAAPSRWMKLVLNCFTQWRWLDEA